MSEPRIVAEGIHFGEGPRWRDGTLWFSDMHGRRVCRLRNGAVESVVELDEEPSGLGWLPDGELLIVAMPSRRLLRWGGGTLTVHADLNALAAADLSFPNGTVITPDRRTLIVGESGAGRLTAFDIDADGALSNRRVWAQLPDAAIPDGICLDAGHGIWSASPSTNEVIRQLEGGAVTHRIGFDRGAYACMLGDEGLYVLTCNDSRPDRCRAATTGRIMLCDAPCERAGWP